MPDATAILNEISGAFDAAANQLLSLLPDDRPLNEIWGWNMPAMNRQEIAAFLREPVVAIQSLTSKELDDADFNMLSTYPSRVQFLSANVIPAFSGGNGFHAYLTTESLIRGIMRILERHSPVEVEWKAVEDQKILPAAQLRKLKQLSSGINKLTADSGNLAQVIAEVNSARAAAESLPADQQSLVEARLEFAEAMKVVEANRGAAEKAKETAEKRLAEIVALKEEAQRLVKATEAAQAAATTQGLGASFDKKAVSLSRSTWGLGLLLAITLAVAAWISSERISFIHNLMLKPNVSMQLFYINVMLTVVSIAGPVWFAWVLTKQIGQRFRLSEDYAFKSSVAKAYEGYRVEAVRIDPELEQRLFRSVLDRIDEPPLRHVEHDSHGSPLHDLFHRKSQKALNTEPAA